MGATQTGSRRTTQKGYMEKEEQGLYEEIMPNLEGTKRLMSCAVCLTFKSCLSSGAISGRY